MQLTGQVIHSQANCVSSPFHAFRALLHLVGRETISLEHGWD